PGSPYTYDVRLFDDDDPAMKGSAFTPVELAAMGPPPDPPEDGNRFNDVNKRLVIRATGFGPRGTQATFEQMLIPMVMPALLVGGDVAIANVVQVTGPRGSVHANGDLTISGTSVTIAQSATATGTISADTAWHPGGLESGDMPRIPVPDIHAADYFADADYVLQADGRITNPPVTTVYCDASATADACRDITPPGGTAPFGWVFDAASGWNLSQDSANSATYYARTNVRITASPGTPVSPVLLTIIAEGDIEITGNPNLRPEPASELQFVTDRDLRISGSPGVPLTLEGRFLVREQIDLSGEATLVGQVIVQDVASLGPLVVSNTITGGVTLSYNGSVETVTYTVSGWREVP
ncbi:MAG: hypothetical protein OEW19_08500, partial [Acidobacteriota bacterium]|nr:hypothetical protein [Acidobacteriota bacterium]